MKRIIAKSTLREYWEKHADSEQYLKTWYDTTKSAKWFSPNDVKQTYINASILTCIIHQNTQYFDKRLFTSQLMLDFKKVNFLKIECFLIYFHTAFALRTS
jgi:mRNA-degrading endonuclease HigB of HigAB toxin-antitoxin module